MAVDYREAVLNFYKHKECGTHWADLWSCGCNDECPKCGGEIEPYANLPVSDIEGRMANIHS
jgi:hypothetical protein